MLRKCEKGKGGLSSADEGEDEYGTLQQYDQACYISGDAKYR